MIALTGLVTSLIISRSKGGGNKVTITGTVAAPAAAAKGSVIGTALAPAAPPYVITPVADKPWRRHMPCDPGPCRRVPNAPVTIVRPTQSGWKAEPTVSGTTDSNGDFSVTVDMGALTKGGPVFIAASDTEGTFTFMSTIPADLVKAGATLNLPVDRTTTAAAVMHCPGGVFPPRSMGGYCYSDPKESTNIETLNSEIDRYFANNPSTTTDFGAYFPALLGDAHIMEALGQIMEANDLPAVSAQQILDSTAELPTFPSGPPVTTPSPKLPSGFPANLPEGVYSVTERNCNSLGTCTEYRQEWNLDKAGLIAYAELISSLRLWGDDYCSREGISCKFIGFSPFDGRSFTATTTRSFYLPPPPGSKGPSWHTQTLTYTFMKMQ